VLLGSLVAWRIEVVRRPKTPLVTIGTKDQVFYRPPVAEQEAEALGHALQNTGFFRNQGSSVLLARSGGSPVVSFVLNEGGWDHPTTIASFEEIGRRVAGSIGGFPIQVHLVDTAWHTQKSLAVGRVFVGKGDVIYYFGLASETDASALGQALRDAGYLADLGVSVVISKDETTTLGFVVGQGVWDRAEAVTGFEQLARQVAPSVGGLPLDVRLLSAEMENKKEVPIR
jgi:hypothetical protein